VAIGALLWWNWNLQGQQRYDEGLLRLLLDVRPGMLRAAVVPRLGRPYYQTTTVDLPDFGIKTTIPPGGFGDFYESYSVTSYVIGPGPNPDIDFLVVYDKRARVLGLATGQVLGPEPMLKVKHA